jgi:hypothetical protein
MSVQLSQLHGFLTSAAGYLSSDADDPTPCEVQSPLSVIMWSALDYEGRSSEDLSPII